MPTVKRLRRHAREGLELSVEQELELVAGIPGGFRDEAARRSAWAAHRERLLENGPGFAWVVYEGGGFLPGEGYRISRALHRLAVKGYEHAHD